MKKKKRGIKIFAVPVILLMFVLCLAPSAHACTEIYVGKDVSEDGSIIMARSNDNQSVWATRAEITEGVENKPGRTMSVGKDSSVQAEIPAKTYKYVSTPMMSSVRNEYTVAADAACCTNECGVAMTMSVTAFSNKAALKADPLVEEGISEMSANDFVICQSATAREAVEILCGLIDKYGSSEVNIATIADKDEVWYIEMYSGHQYAAVKLPSDMVAVFGNEFNLEYLSEYEDSIVSKDLEILPVKNNFAKYSEDGELNLLKTYSGEEKLADYSHMRTWIGHKLMAPKDYGDYDIEETYPLVFKPEGKVSLKDVFELMRNRYEGTEYSPEEQGREDVRVIGTDTAMSVHVLQVYPEYPSEMSCVIWMCLGPDPCGVFVPLSNCCTSLDSSFGKDQSVEEGTVFNPEEYMWYNIKAINAVGLTDYEAYGKPVRDYWSGVEDILIKDMAEVLKDNAEIYGKDSEKAEKAITEYCCKVQKKAFEDAGSILRSQMWTMCYNSNTMKFGTNPETHEVLKEKRELKKVELDLDSSGYKLDPDTEEAETAEVTPSEEKNGDKAESTAPEKPETETEEKTSGEDAQDNSI